jgi:hypothetical protein
VRIATIVEGHADVMAVPVLLRRLASSHGTTTTVLPPIRVPRGKLTKKDEFQRAIELAARRTTTADRILVLFDADDDCAARLAPQLHDALPAGAIDDVARPPDDEHAPTAPPAVAPNVARALFDDDVPRDVGQPRLEGIGQQQDLGVQREAGEAGSVGHRDAVPAEVHRRSHATRIAGHGKRRRRRGPQRRMAPFRKML